MEPYTDNEYNQYQQQPPYPPYPPAVTNGKAIAALILGILAFTPYVGIILGILAIIFGALALKEIKVKNEQGRGLAIAGLVCGIVGTILYLIIIIFLIIIFVIAVNEPTTYDAMSILSSRFIG
ncbi:DUF4190 domain-containing protein [Paenibacillus pini]|uniref:DUF4190 domain-containing protein n=1 Tax=Paenibacillus pini JCM 16418 TaxID=1236976 RepID=W7Z7M2_9BACL|nr:DUF4190 domain-containing protein [Paenibacillus pini]GAF10399.1 hypothetical protein JCM16418_4602 [Paenibacillus pini JCM 16418]